MGGGAVTGALRLPVVRLDAADDGAFRTNEFHDVVVIGAFAGDSTWGWDKHRARSSDVRIVASAQ